MKKKKRKTSGKPKAKTGSKSNMTIASDPSGRRKLPKPYISEEEWAAKRGGVAGGVRRFYRGVTSIDIEWAMLTSTKR